MNEKAPSGWQRARRPEQKEERRNAILKAAGRLLDEAGLEGAGLNAIAREVGITKPNIYRYFESREAILIELLVIEVRDWRKAIEHSLPSLPQNDFEAFAEALATSLDQRARFCLLLGALASVLEHNVGVETVTSFKGKLLAEIALVTSIVSRVVDRLPEEEVGSLMASILMAASGMWPHCHPSPVVKEVLAREEFAPMRFDFHTMVRDLTRDVLRGRMADP
jgi:AcrR family transcriptional regulator